MFSGTEDKNADPTRPTLTRRRVRFPAKMENPILTRKKWIAKCHFRLISC